MTVMSYCGTVYFGINGCRETVPDIGAFPGMLIESLDELLAAARTRRPAGSKGRTSSPRKRGSGST